MPGKFFLWGAGKSHLVSLYVVYTLLKNPNSTIMIMSAKRELAERNARFIKKVIESNPLTAKLRGNGKWTDTLFFIDRQRNQLNPSVTCSNGAALCFLSVPLHQPSYLAELATPCC
jgi:hypothetical protein